jgi:hypothetical protein
MKKKLLFSIAGAFVLAITLSTFIESRSLTPPPTARSGGPGDISGTTTHRNCASSCHTTHGTIVKAGWITSDVPASGYLPGQTYNITVSISSPAVRFGFTASCQDVAGNFKGTLVMNDSTWVVTDAGKSWIFQRDSTNAVASGLIHSIGYAGTGLDPNFKSWTFGWTAPASGTGTLTFYSSMVAGDGNAAATNDSVFNSSLEIIEDPTAGINNISFDQISLYPNPTLGQFHLNNLPYSSRIEIYNVAGQMVYNTINNEPTLYVNINDQAPGIYFVKIMNANNQKVLKLLAK